MLHARHWLSWDDGYENVNSGVFREQRDAFMAIFKEEELRVDTEDIEHLLGGTLSSVVEENWAFGRVWLHTALMSKNGMEVLLDSFFLPRFHLSHVPSADLCLLWRPNAAEIMERKLRDRHDHLQSLSRLFSS